MLRYSPGLSGVWRKGLAAAFVALVLAAPAWPAAPPAVGGPDRAKSKARDDALALAEKLEKSGDLAGAVEAARRGLALEQAMLGLAHEDVLRTLNLLGRLHQARNDLAEARRVLLEAIRVSETIHGQGDWRVANARQALTDLERWQRMSVWERKAWNEASALPGRIGLLYRAGKGREAVALARHAVALRWRLLGRPHPELAISLNNLGVMHFGKLNFDQAALALREAVAVRRQLYPPSLYPAGHPALAAVLTNLGAMLRDRGDYPGAEEAYRDALACLRKLHPAESHPQGHPLVARTLNNYGALLHDLGDYDRAEGLIRESLSIHRRLQTTAPSPDNLRDHANCLNSLGAILMDRGELVQAEKVHRAALELRRKLFPKELHPNGHQDIASSLNNLATLLGFRGEFAQAEALHLEALAIRKTLHPETRYPDGHPEVASSLNNLGSLLLQRGAAEKAERYALAALAMRRKLYSEARFPNGHPELARSLANFGEMLTLQGDLARAEACAREVLAMRRKLYPKSRYPNGHPEVATATNNLGMLVARRGDRTGAEQLLRESLAMFRGCYPVNRYPNGHPDLAASLSNRGAALIDQGDEVAGFECLSEAMTMLQGLAWTFASTEAQSEALNYLARLSIPREAILGATASPGAALPDPYPQVWKDKLALTRMLQLRASALRALPDDPLQGKVVELRRVRMELSNLLLAPVRGRGAARDRHLNLLTRRKEELEKELGRSMPALPTAAPSPAELTRILPRDSAFVDFYRYRPWHRGSWQAARYAAWVLLPSQVPRRVELGPAESLDRDLHDWRAALAVGKTSPAASRLRRQVWDRLGLPSGTTTVWVAPEGELNALPWVALPGRRSETILLEECAVAVVPHGLMLLEQLQTPTRYESGTLLVVGGVQFGAREGERGWTQLPGTDREVRQVASLARLVSSPFPLRQQSGGAATTARVLDSLGDAQWAHLATHGFFAAPGSRERSKLYDERDFLRGTQGERRGAAARNPLTQVGLVLAGANAPAPDGSDSGILTGETIAGRDLSRLRLAVLSACDTGLGEIDRHAGLFGLQQAFHLAGCRNVVASLWKVDDEATAALMALFYREMWVKGRTPLEALRQAQLHLYRHPELLAALGKLRDSDWVEESLPVRRPLERSLGRASPRLWASFVLSGAGR